MKTHHQTATPYSRSQSVRGHSIEAAPELTVELLVCATILTGLFAAISTLMN